MARGQEGAEKGGREGEGEEDGQIDEREREKEIALGEPVNEYTQRKKERENVRVVRRLA